MRVAVIATAVCLSIVGLADAQDAKAAMRMPTNIPAQDLGSALKAFAQSRDLQVLYFSQMVRDLRTSGASGELTADEALTQLLSGTGLVYRYVDAKAVTILPAGAEAGAALPTKGDDADPGKRGQGASFWERFRTAQVAQEPNPQTSAVSVAGKADTYNASRLEEIVVTAQKREERLIDVPISIAAISGEELQQRQITTLEDLPYAVPDLAYVKTGNNYIFEIRGISNNSGTTPLVGTYIDDADVTLGGVANTQVNPVTYDLERVEVLRGPQGTLYGEGSAGGTVRFITKNPNLTRFDFDSQVAALFTEGGGPSERVNAAINVPLIQGQLGLRVASTFEHEGGWIDQPTADQKDINSRDLTNVRVKGLWQPDPRLTVNAMAIINRDDRGMDFSDPGSSGSWTQVLNLTTTPRLRNEYDLYHLSAAYDISPAVRILNATSYVRASAPVQNYSALYQLTEPGTPALASYYSQQTVDHLLTDELRMTSIDAGSLQWTVGGFYRHYRDKIDIPLAYSGPQGPPGTPLPTPFPFAVETLFKSWSAFGDANYRLWDRITVGAGLRYFRESQEFSDLVALTQQNGQFHSLDPRVYAQFKPTQDVNVYASAGKGFRSGGFNSLGQPTYNPESVWTYELGTKMALMEGRLGVDTAVFLSSYADYQILGFAPGVALSYYTNAGRARIKGVEASTIWHPSRGWTLEARGAYVNGRFVEINATQTAYETGDPLDFVPRYQFTLSGQRDFSVLEKQASIRLDYSQQGPETYRNRNINGPSPWFYAQSEVIQLLNLRVDLFLNDNLKVGFVAQNLLNDQGFTSPFYYIANGVRSRPRTFGVDFSMTSH